MHSRLADQIRRHFGEPEAVPPQWREFLAEVDRSYRELEDSRAILDRALALTSSDTPRPGLSASPLVQAFPDLYFRIDLTGRILACRAGSVADALRPAVELVGCRIQAVPQRDVGRRFAAAIEEVKSTKAAAGFQYSMSVRGVEGHYEARLVPLPDDEIFVIIRNNTERRLAEKALKASEFFLRKSQAVAHIGFYYFNAQTGNWLSSPAFDDIVGIDESYPRDLDGWIALIHPEQQSEILQHLREHVLAGRKPFDREYQVLRRCDQQERWVRCLGELEFDEQGNTVKMLGTIQDITELKNSERALRIKDRAIESSLSAVALTDLEGRLTYVNPSFLRMWGYTRAEEVIGQVATQFSGIPREAPSIVAALRTEGSWSGELVARRRDGEAFCIDLSATLVRNLDGRPIGLMASIVDVTERRQMQERLRQSEERLQQAIQVSGIGIFEHDHQTNVIHYSPEMRRYHGIGPEEPLTVARIVASMHPEDRARITAAICRAHDPTGDGRYDVEYRVLLRDGSVRWVLTRSQTFFEVEGGERRPARTVGAAMDFTEYRKVTEALREGEERLRMALAAANQGLYDLNVQTGEAVVSPEYALMLGYDPATFRETNETWRERLHPDDREPVYRAYSEYILGLRPEYRVEFRQKTRTGEWKWILSLGMVVARDASGRPLRMLGTHSDITHRKRAEEALSLSMERFSLAMEAANDGLWDWHVPSGRAYFSPRYCAMLGYEPDALPASYETWLSLVHPDDRIPAEQKVNDYLNQRSESYEGEFRMRHQSGAYLWILSRGKVVERDSRGAAVRLVGIHSDITERKQAQERLARARDELESKVQERTRELTHAKFVAESASQAKSRFLAMMSHEIRTPLNGVTAVLHLLQKENLSLQQQRWIEMAATSAGTLLRVINDILDFSKVEAGKLDLHLAATDLREAVQTTMNAFAERTVAKGLRGSVAIDPELPARVSTDAGRLGQILGNLLGNAVKFTDAGSVGIRVKLVSLVQGTALVRFEVADTGAGISADQQERLFKPFSQVDSSRTRRHGGTGLGLGICKHLVELMGGSIGVESVVGEGSVFWFELPFQVAEVAAEVVPAEDPRRTDRSAEALPTEPRPAVARVLLAEDNEINQELAREMIQFAGCVCECVVNGREAVEAVASGSYDLVFMDCMMPEMDGYTATQAIRAGEIGRAQAGGMQRRLPIIAMTANAMEGDREECLAAGMDDYMSKPLDPEEVARMVRKWLSATPPAARSGEVARPAPLPSHQASADDWGR